MRVQSAKYELIHVPSMVSERMMINTGQLPKFKRDQFQINNGGYLSPTGEVQLGNLAITGPRMLTTLTKCFRNEVSYGATAKGLMRNIEFEKIELFSYCGPEEMSADLESKFKLISSILRSLELQYRLIRLPCNDMSGSAMITFDFEVGLPVSNRFLEVSSVSACGDYQSRRRGLKGRRGGDRIHPSTTNGSCLPIGRIMIALSEKHGLNRAIGLLRRLISLENQELAE